MRIEREKSGKLEINEVRVIYREREKER